MQRMVDELEGYGVEAETAELKGIDSAEGKQRIVVDPYERFFAAVPHKRNNTDLECLSPRVRGSPNCLCGWCGHWACDGLSPRVRGSHSHGQPWPGILPRVYPRECGAAL